MSAGSDIPTAAPPSPEVTALVSLMRERVSGLGEEDTDDFDIFIETALRLRAALDQYPHDRLWIRQSFRNLATDTAICAGTGEVCTIPAIDDSVSVWGSLTVRDAKPETELLTMDRSYQDLSFWPEVNGRHMELSSVGIDHATDESDYSHLCAAIRRAALASPTLSAVLKPVLAEKSHPLIHLDDIAHCDDETMTARIQKATFDDWFLYSIAGKENSLLVQSKIAMRFEHRFFVVDGTPVTGAPCVEEHTPLDREGERWPARSRAVRGHGELVDASSLVDMVLLPFARKVAWQIQQERPELRTYTLDVAVDETTGRPLVVELNGMLNAGLYQSDPSALFAALMAADAFPVLNLSGPWLQRELARFSITHSTLA